MPNIIDYHTPLGLAPQPTDKGEATAREAAQAQERYGYDKTRAMGRTVSQVGGQIGEAVDKHITMMDVSHASAVASESYVNLGKQWAQMRDQTDPNDASIAATFNQAVFQPWADNYLKQFDGKSAEAQAFAQRKVEAMRQEFFHTVTADMATRAGDAIHQNHIKATKNDTQAAYDNPTLLNRDYLHEQAAQDTETWLTSPNLTAAQKASVKNTLLQERYKQIDAAAIIGMARNNPQQLIEDINSGKLKDFDPELVEKGLAKARTNIDVGHSQARWEQEQADKAYNEHANKTEVNYIQQVMGGGKVGDYANDPAFARSPDKIMRIKSFIDNKMNNADTTPHPANVAAMQEKIWKTQRDDPDSVPALRSQVIADVGKHLYNNQESDYLMNLITKSGDHMLQHANSIASSIIAASQKDFESKFELQMPGNADIFAANRIKYNNYVQSVFEKEAAKGNDAHLGALYDPDNAASPFNPKIVRTMLWAGIKSGTAALADQAYIVRTESGAESLANQIPTDMPITPVAAKHPAIGTVQGGYKFKGGNPADPKSWEKM